MSMEIKNTEKDFRMMIEKSYDILSNYEKKNNEFYNSFREVDKKIIEKETAFASAKNNLKEFKKKMIDTAEKVEAQKEEITELKKELTSTKKLIFYILGINIFLIGAIIYLIVK